MQKVAMLHYSAPPVIGGVEGVMLAHCRQLVRAGFTPRVVAGRGEASALPQGCEWVSVAEMDSQYPAILEMSRFLERGEVPPAFGEMQAQLAAALERALEGCQSVILHNLLSKHFNLPLTLAVLDRVAAEPQRNWIAWGHDFSGSSPNSRRKLHPGMPWQALLEPVAGVTYVAVSQARQAELAQLLDVPLETIRVVYNGVEPGELLHWSREGEALIERLGLLDSDLNLIYPVRVTQAKNIELALEVVAALQGAGLRPKLVVTGPPDPHEAASMQYFEELKARRAALGVEQAARFVFESGPDSSQPYWISAEVVGDLLRASDALLMPSHREGFGIPILEAGLAGLKVFSTAIPAARELGAQEVTFFEDDSDPRAVAQTILQWAEGDAVARLKRRVRQEFTWRAIFERDLLPLLEGKAA